MKTLLLSLLLSAVLCAADVTGKWSGVFEFKNDQGETRSEPAFLILKQEGARLSGSGGPNEGEQHAFQNGTVDGAILVFEIPLGGERTIQFKLKASGDAIQGDMKMPRKDGVIQEATMSIKRVAEK